MIWGVQHPVAISVTEQVVQGGVEAAFDVELPGSGIDELAEAGTKAVIRTAPDIATKIAREGGKHAGQLKQFLKQTPEQLLKTIKSFNNQITKHEEWINNPTSKIVDFNELRPEHQQNLLHHWRQDIARHQELKAIAEDVLSGL